MSYTHAHTDPAPPGPPAPPPGAGSNGLATAGFVLGLLGLLICWIPLLNIVGILMGILGAVMAAVGLSRAKRTRSGKGLAISGLVLGGLAVILAIAVNVAFVDAVDSAVDEADDVPSSTVGAADQKPDADDADAEEEYSFVDGVLTTEDVKIVIIKHEVVAAGQGANQYGDKPVINFVYETTNVSGAETDPSTAWLFAINAFQDNDPNSENELDLAFGFDSPYLDSSHENIKKGGTVTNDMAYELDDLTTPVDLVATELFGSDLGTVTFKVK